LIVAGPGVRAGVSSNALVSLQDLTATFLDAADAPALPGMDARSLTPLLSGETTTHRDVLISALADWQVAYDGRYKLVAGVEPSPMLFDLEVDPDELVNIADQAPEIVDRLSPKLV
jgi:choline-sulfatase